MSHPVLEDPDERIRVPGGRKQLGQRGLGHGSSLPHDRRRTEPREPCDTWNDWFVPRLGTCRASYAGSRCAPRMWQSSGGRAGLIDVRGRALADDDVRVPAGWYPDPLGLPQLRWWDNHAWTEHTSDARQPMMAQETVVSARLAYKDDDEDDRDEQAFDDLPTRRQRREQEQPREDERRRGRPRRRRPSQCRRPALPRSALEAGARPRAALARRAHREHRPAGERADERALPPRHAVRRPDGGTTKPWAFDDPDGADEPYGYCRRSLRSRLLRPARPVRLPRRPLQPSRRHAEVRTAGPADVGPAGAVRRKPEPPGQLLVLGRSVLAAAESVRAAGRAAAARIRPAAAPARPVSDSSPADARYGQPAFAPGVRVSAPAGSAVPMYTPTFSPDAAPDLQPVAYPTRRGTLDPGLASGQHRTDLGDGAPSRHHARARPAVPPVGRRGQALPDLRRRHHRRTLPARDRPRDRRPHCAPAARLRAHGELGLGDSRSAGLPHRAARQRRPGDGARVRPAAHLDRHGPADASSPSSPSRGSSWRSRRRRSRPRPRPRSAATRPPNRAARSQLPGGSAAADPADDAAARRSATPRSSTHTVSLQRSNGWIDWRVDDWGLYATNR